jgi:hypothetical protein
LTASAFNGEKATAGAISLTIGSIPTITNLNASQVFMVVVSNSSAATLT